MNKRNIIALLLAITIILGLVMPAFAAEADDNAEDTEATAETQPEVEFETIPIKDSEDLMELAQLCRLDTWSVGKLVILQADISLHDVSFLPIPSFGGIFDGNGHTISSLHLTASVTPAGLFGELQMTGVIKDLTVSGTVSPSGDAVYVGGIVGENHGSITNCSFTGSILGESNVGAIAGVNALTGKIIGCEASGTVIGSDMTGGISGCNLGIIGDCENSTYINTVSVDPTVDPEDITFDYFTDISKLTSLDTSSAAMDTGGIAGYSSGMIGNCTNKASVGYPHIGYNVGGIAGRSCGYIHDCENTAEVYGRKDVGGITGQMEPYISKNLTESTLAKLERQLGELDVLIDQALEHADGMSNTVTNRLNGIASSMGAAGSALQDIRTTGTISSNVTGSGETSSEGSMTVTPPQIEVGGENGAGGSVDVEVSSGSGSIDIITGSGGEIHAGLTESGVSGEGSISGIGGVDAETQISISTNMAGLASSLYGMAGQMSMLSGEMDSAAEELMADVELIRAKISEITETGFSLIVGDGEEDAIIDSSEWDIDLITLGKVSDCTNNGHINGDINVGGIAGCMGMEYALDPEDDVTVSVDGSTRRTYEVKAVIQRCENTGAVTAKRNYAGGMTGKMDLGLIAQCESYGSVTSESGNYVGGIAGIGSSTIRHCFSKCTLSGGKYVGGIVGSGVQEDRNGDSSTVAACYAIVTITDYKQYAGAVSGDYAGTFLENYFVSEELAGINRMSYTGCAEPVSYDELIALFTEAEKPDAEETVPEEPEATEETTDTETVEMVETEPTIEVPPMELPDEFRKFNLKFVVDDEVIHSEIFDYGASFGEDVFPEIPAKEGYYSYWDIEELNNLKFDTTVTAVYVPYITAVSSSDLRDGAQNVFFVEGDFADEDALKVKTMALSSAAFDLPEGIWDGICKSFTHTQLNTEVVEQWQLIIPDDGKQTHTVRYLPPDGKAESMDVYTLCDSEWSKTETTVIGSYVTFPVEGNDVHIAVVSTMQVWWVWLIAGLVALILLVLIIRILRKVIKPKPKAIPASSENASGDEADEEEIIRVPPPMKKRKPWLTVLLVILALLIGIAGTTAFFLIPDLMADVGAYEILKDYSEKEELSMTLSVEATVNDRSYPITANLDRTMKNGQRITLVSENESSLYYADGAVFLENGDAYQIGTAFPDYSKVLEQAMALYKHIEIEEKDDIYTITANGSDARVILELLIPSAASGFADAETLKVELITDGSVLKKLRFTGSGKGYSVDATLKILDTPRTVEIPGTVMDTITSGDYESMDALSDDLYRLANGWQDLNSRNPLCAELMLKADCGPLVLNENLQLFRWADDGGDIFCVQENGYALYFTEDAVYDAKGNTIPLASASNIDAAKLLDIAYAACMNISAECKSSGDQYTYTLSLDEDGMESVAYAVAPEAEKLNISFASGTIRVVVDGDTIESVSVEVSGSVQVVLSHADVSIGAELQFSKESVDATIPDAVKENINR